MLSDSFKMKQHHQQQTDGSSPGPPGPPSCMFKIRRRPPAPTWIFIFTFRTATENTLDQIKSLIWRNKLGSHPTRTTGPIRTFTFVLWIDQKVVLFHLFQYLEANILNVEDVLLLQNP